MSDLEQHLQDGDGELVEVRAALDELRREIVRRFGAGTDEPESARVAWGTLITQLSRRASILGMRERSGEVDEFGMDEIVLRRTRPLLDLLYDRYWRVDLAGQEHIPDEGPYLLVANRSGLLPYDGLMLSHAVERARSPGRRPRFFVADWLVTQPFVQSYLARVGGVRACRENAERLLRRGHPVIVFPEGVKGAAKVFRERYRLKRFGRGGVIRLALENRVPMLPVGIVGGEEVHPILFKWGAPARALGLPFLPVTPTFPLLGALGLLPLPSKWVIRVGKPVAIEHLGPSDAADEILLSRLTEELRREIQVLVDEGLRARPSVWS